MLYICPTPIGNLRDITLRVLDVLAAADVIACEDTRHTGLLLKRHGITPARLISFHGYNEQGRLELILPLLRENKTVALVSDAGMPGLSDPGFSLVRACVRENLPVTVLPGPSAITTALVLSGLPADCYAFVGFLARGKKALLAQLERFDHVGATLVAFDSPRRVRASLAAIAERWPAREIALCRELTKLHEQVIRGTATQVLAQLPDPVRGEVVLVLGPSQEMAGAARSSDVGETTVREALLELLEAGLGTKKASLVAAKLSGLPSRRVYELALLAKRTLSSSC